MVPVLLLALLLAGGPTSVLSTTCAPGYWWYERNGLQHCKECLPGCACAGGMSPCLGCSGGFYSPTKGQAACIPCPEGEVSDYIFNSGCDAFSTRLPCQNDFGPLGQTRCRSTPPPQGVNFSMPVPTVGNIPSPTEIFPEASVASAAVAMTGLPPGAMPCVIQ